MENANSGLDRERIINLYRISSYGLIGNLIFPLVGCIILWPHFRNLHLIAWTVTIVGFNSIRIYLVRGAYSRILQNRVSNFQNLHTAFFILTVVSAAIWSSLAYLPGNPNLGEYLFDLQFILGIATIAAIATLFLSLPSTLSFVSITGLVLVTRLLLQSSPKYNIVGINTFLFTVALIVLAIYLYKIQTRFIGLATENEKLLEDQKRADEEIKQLNTSLKKRLFEERVIATGIQDALDFQSRIIENSLSGVFVIDKGGYFIQVNEIGARILGKSKGELFGKKFNSYLESSSSKKLSAKLRAVLKTGKVVKGLESTIRKKDGGTVHILLNASPLISDKNISGIVVIAEDNTQKYREESLRKTREESLEMLAGAVKFEAIIGNILTGISRLYPEFRPAFFFFDDRSERFNYKLSVGISESLRKYYAADKSGSSPHHVARSNRKPLIIEDVTRESLPRELQSSFKRNRVVSIISIPIIDSRSRITGILEVYSSSSNMPAGIDFHILKEFAQLLGLTAERKKIEYELLIKNKRLTSLYELSSAILKEVNPTRLFERIFNVLRDMPETQTIDRMKIFLPRGDHLVLFYNSEKQDDHSNFCSKVKPGECLCGQAYATGEVMISENSATDPAHILREMSIPPHSHIVVPLIGRDKICGVLCLYSSLIRRENSDSIKFFFLSVGRQIGLALENASLYEELRQMSLNDPLTGLANRHSMSIMLQKIIPQAKRRKLPLSIAFLDIDHFKKFNDTHGHAQGDELLVNVGKIIRQMVREEDLAVRYGGEEFLLILAETDLKTAESIVERIRLKVKKDTRISISAGLAPHSPDNSFEETLDLADKALYRAKESGRNRIVIANFQEKT